MSSIVLRVSWLWLALTFVSAGCGDDASTNDSSSDLDADTDTDDTDTNTDVETVTIYGRFSVWPSETGLVGEVCWNDGLNNPCTYTTSDGNYAITNVPGERAGVLEAMGSDIVPARMPLVLGTEDLEANLGLDGVEFLADLYAVAGIEPIEGRSTIAIQTWNPLFGNTIALDPESWDGPFYMSDKEPTFDLSAITTTNCGIAYFLNVDPATGPYTINAKNGDQPCILPYIGAAVPDSLDPAPGTVTNVTVECN